MNPLPVALRLAVPACGGAVTAIGVGVGVEPRRAVPAAAPPHWPVIGGPRSAPTHRMSDHVSRPFFLSIVWAAGTTGPLNDAAVTSPHEARISGLNGTRPLWGRSTAESIRPVPQ